MKKATTDTRIRITIKMPVAGDTTLTMSACAWNEMSTAYSQAAKYWDSLNCHAVAAAYRDIADRIYYVLDAHGYYDDASGIGQAFNPD